MGIGSINVLEPTESDAVFLFLCVQPPKLEAGLGEARVDPRRLREEVMLPLRRGGQQAADVAFDRVDAQWRPRTPELLFRWRRFRGERLYGLPSQMGLDSSQIFERSQLGQLRALLDAFQVQNTAGDAQRAFRGRGSRGQRILAENDASGIERLTELDHRSVRQQRVGTDREAA